MRTARRSRRVPGMKQQISRESIGEERRSTQPVEKSIPGTYKVGGRRMSKPTSRDRDSSLGINKAPGKMSLLPGSADRHPRYRPVLIRLPQNSRFRLPGQPSFYGRAAGCLRTGAAGRRGRTALGSTTLPLARGCKRGWLSGPGVHAHHCPAFRRRSWRPHAPRSLLGGAHSRAGSFEQRKAQPRLTRAGG